MGAARSLGRHWLGTWFEAKQACGVGEMAHRYALVARTAKGNTAEPQQVGTWRMDGRARTHRRGFLLSNPLQTKMGMGTWLEACHVGEMASRQGSQCFTLPLRLPLSQSRGVGGYIWRIGPFSKSLNQRKAKQNLRIPKPCASTGLVPDEPRIAERVRLALDGDSLPDPLQEPEANSEIDRSWNTGRLIIPQR